MMFPLNYQDCNGIPINHHQGAFGFHRKYDIHTGVDLYCRKDSSVYAMEDGMIIGIDLFTGSSVGSDWWNETKYILIDSQCGTICYGEIEPLVKVGDFVKEGDVIGRVIPVLPEYKVRKDIAGHSNYMLHMELYQKPIADPVVWGLNQCKPELLLDITPLLINSSENKLPFLTT